MNVKGVATVSCASGQTVTSWSSKMLVAKGRPVRSQNKFANRYYRVPLQPPETNPLTSSAMASIMWTASW
jgi:hypothetical protein